MRNRHAAPFLSILVGVNGFYVESYMVVSFRFCGCKYGVFVF